MRTRVVLTFGATVETVEKRVLTDADFERRTFRFFFVLSLC